MSSADDDFKARLARFLPQQQTNPHPLTQQQNQQVDKSAKITFGASTTTEVQPGGGSSSLLPGFRRSLFTGVGSSLLSRPPRTLGDGFRKKPNSDNSNIEHQASHTDAHNSGAEPNGHLSSARPISSSPDPSSDANGGRTVVVAPTPSPLRKISVADPALTNNYTTSCSNTSKKSTVGKGGAANTLKNGISPSAAPPSPLSTLPRLEGSSSGGITLFGRADGGGPTEASSTRAPTPCGDNQTSSSPSVLGSAEGLTYGGQKVDSYASKFKLPPSRRGGRGGGGEPSPSSSSSSTSRSSSSSSSEEEKAKEKQQEVRGGEGQGEQGQDEWCHPVSPVTSAATSEPLYTPRMTTARARGATLPIKRGGLGLPAARGGTVSSNANCPDDASDDTNTNSLGIKSSFAEQLAERMAARRAAETEDALKEAKDSRSGHGDPYAMSRHQGFQERLSARVDSLRSTNHAESSADVLSKRGTAAAYPSSLLTPSMTAAATLLIGAIDAYVDEVDVHEEQDSLNKEEKGCGAATEPSPSAAKGQPARKGLTSHQRTVTSIATAPTRRVSSPPLTKSSAPSASASAPPRLVDYLIDRQIQQTLEDRAHKERVAQQRVEIEHFKDAIKGISVSKAYTAEAQRATAFHAAKAQLESAMGTTKKKYVSPNGIADENHWEVEEGRGGSGAAFAAKKVTQAVNALYGGVDGLGRQHRVARASAANVAHAKAATVSGPKTAPLSKSAVATNKTSHVKTASQRCSSSNKVRAGGGAASGSDGGGAFHDPRFPLLSSAHRKEVLLMYDQLHRGKDLLRLASFMIREAFVLGASTAMAHQQQDSDARHEARKAAIASRAALSPGRGSSYALFLSSAADRSGERSRIRAHLRERSLRINTNQQNAAVSGGIDGGAEGPLVLEADDFGVPLALIDALGDLSSRLATRKRERSAFLRNYEKAEELAERTRQQLVSATAHEKRNERSPVVCGDLRDLLHFCDGFGDDGATDKNANIGAPSTLASYCGDEGDCGAPHEMHRRRRSDDGCRGQERLAASGGASPAARQPSSRLDEEGGADKANTKEKTTNEAITTISPVSPSAIPFSSFLSAASFQLNHHRYPDTNLVAYHNLEDASSLSLLHGGGVGPRDPSRVPSPQLPRHFAASSSAKALDQATRDKYVRDAINYLRSLDFGKWVNGASNSTHGTGAGDTAGAVAHDVHDLDRFYPHHPATNAYDDDGDEHREKLRKGLMGMGMGRASRVDDGKKHNNRGRKKRAKKNAKTKDDIGVHESASQAPSNTSSSATSSRRQRQQEEEGEERVFGSFYSSSSRSSGGYVTSSEGASAGDGTSQDLGSFIDDHHDDSTHDEAGAQSKHRRRDPQRGGKNRGGGAADDGPLSALQQKKNAFELICKSAYADHPLARDEEMGRREKLRQLFVEEVQHLQAMAVPGRRLAASLPREFVAAGDSFSGPVRALSPVASANPYRFSPPAPQRFVPEYLCGAPTSAKQYTKSNMANIEKDRLNRRKIAATGGAGSGSVVGGGSSITGASSMSSSSAQQAPPFYYSSSLAGAGPSLKPPKSILGGSSSSLVNLNNGYAEDTNNGTGLARSSSLRFAVPEGGAKSADGRRGDRSCYGVRFAEDLHHSKNADETDTNISYRDNNNPLNLSVGSDNQEWSGGREGEEGSSTGRPRVSSLQGSVRRNWVSDDDEETRQILANDSEL